MNGYYEKTLNNYRFMVAVTIIKKRGHDTPFCT